MRYLTLLYPPAWRARYESELRALVDEQGANPRLAIDLVRGAIDAWLTGPRWGRAALVFWGAILAFVATTGVYFAAKRVFAPSGDIETAFELLYWALYIVFVGWLTRQRGVTCDLTRFRRTR